MKLPTKAEAEARIQARIEEIRSWHFTCMRIDPKEAERIARKEAVAEIAQLHRAGQASVEDVANAEVLFGMKNPLSD